MYQTKGKGNKYVQNDLICNLSLRLTSENARSLLSSQGSSFPFCLRLIYTLFSSCKRGTFLSELGSSLSSTHCWSCCPSTSLICPHDITKYPIPITTDPITLQKQK